VRSRPSKVLLVKSASAQTTADRATDAIKAAELIFVDEMGATLGLTRQNVGLITKTPPFDPSHCGVSRTIRTRSTLGWGAAQSGRCAGLAQVGDYPFFSPPVRRLCRDCDFSGATIAARLSSSSDRV